MGLEKPEEAKKYLESFHKKPLKEIIKDEAPLKVDKHKQKKIDHVKTANAMLKFINVVPMSKVSRRIMNYKILNPGMSSMAVALANGLMEHEVLKYEKDGVMACSAYMRRMSLQDATNKFNSDTAVFNAVRNLKNNANPN